MSGSTVTWIRVITAFAFSTAQAAGPDMRTPAKLPWTMIHAFAWMLLIKGLIRQNRKLLAVGTISKAGAIFTIQTPVCRIRYCFHPEKTPGENIHNKATKEAFVYPVPRPTLFEDLSDR